MAALPRCEQDTCHNRELWQREGLQPLLLDLLLFYLLFCSEVLHINSGRKLRQEECLTAATEHLTHLFGLAELNAQFCV